MLLLIVAAAARIVIVGVDLIVGKGLQVRGEICLKVEIAAAGAAAVAPVAVAGLLMEVGVVVDSGMLFAGLGIG